MIVADVAIVLVAAYIMTVPVAAIVAVVLGILFVRWWQRSAP